MLRAARAPLFARVVLFASTALACAFAGRSGLPAKDAPTAKIPLQVNDLFLNEGFSTLVVSPDRGRAACIRYWIDPATHAERHSLWLVRGSGDHRQAMESGEPDARSPVFSPDGKWIAFQSTRPLPPGVAPLLTVPPASDPVTDIWLISAEGGKAMPLAFPSKPYGRVFDDGFYGRVAFSPDGKKLLFVADDGQLDRTSDELAGDAEIVRSDQGEGYTGYRPAQLWIAELKSSRRDYAAASFMRLTEDDVWYGDPQWSPDGRTVVAHANKTTDREAARWSLNKNYDLWEITVANRSQRRLTNTPGADLYPRFSPDGSRLACLTSPRNAGHYDVLSLAVVTLGAEPKLEIVVDGDNLKAGQWEPSLTLADRVWDGPDRLVYEGVRGMKSALVSVDVKTGSARPYVAGDSAEARGEMARWKEARAKLSPTVSTYRANRLASETRLVTWKNDAGQEIEGAVTLPPAEVASPPYKLIVYPHGGPHGRDGQSPSFAVEVFAANGYAVFRPNFRGSLGYGRKFLDAARRDMGGADMRDILTGVDYLVSEKLADPKRQFVYGTSYGGFMTCWLVGHTRQFRAAAAQNAVTDLDVMWGTSDLKSWTEWELGGRPWEVPEAMRRLSPITYADQIHTPTLVLHSRDDRRCPLPMGRMFYQALKGCGVETEMVIYPDEGHVIRQPRHQADVLRRVLAWFAAHDEKPAASETKSGG